MQTVVVTNNSGIRLNHMGKLVKSVREFMGDQSFSFKTCAEALSFERYMNNHPAKGLKALYSPSEESLEAEGIKLTTSTETADIGSVDEDALKVRIAELAASLEADNSKAELLKLAESMGLEGYSDLTKNPLAVLIATAQLAEQKDAE